MKKIETYLPWCLGILLLFPLFLPLTKLGIIPFLLVLGILLYLVHTKKTDHFPFILFIFAFLLRFLAICLINTPIESDFQTMYEGAKQINAGNITLIQESPYFQLWGYQLGHTIYMSFFLKLIPSVFFLKLLNCLFSSFSIVLLYRIGKDFVQEKIARVFSLLYACFPFPLLLNTVLTNQHHSTFFLLLAVYFLVSKKHQDDSPWKKGALIGLFLALSNFLRPEGIVFLLAFLVYLLFSISKKNQKQILQLGGTTLMLYFLLSSSFSFFIQESKLNATGLKNNDPYWKLVTGLNMQTMGQYSEEDAKNYTFQNKKEALSLIKERSIKNLSHLPKLFLQKETILWTHSDLAWSIGHFPREGNSDLYYFLTNFNQCFIYFFLIAGILGCFVKVVYKERIFFILFLGAYFGVYLFIEVMPRYAYTPQTILLLLGMIGVNTLVETHKFSLDK